MRAWIDQSGELYIARDKNAAGDAIAPVRPSSNHQWISGQGWILDLAISRASATASINAKAEEVRLRYITPGAGQAGTYLIKEREAEAYRDAGYTGDVPGMVAAEVSATGLTTTEAADLILAQRDLWVVKAAQIEGARRTGNVDLEATTTIAEIDALLAATLAALNAL